jgi:hypothetical protein
MAHRLLSIGQDNEREVPMSSRFKRIKRKRKGKVVNVNMEGGRLTGERCGASGWLRLLEIEADAGIKEGAPGFQQSACQTTGDVYVRPMDGRYRDVPESVLRGMIDDMLQVFVRAGYPPVLDPRMPLWRQAEFLDNMLDFELHPPCGCESELKHVIGSA